MIEKKLTWEPAAEHGWKCAWIVRFAMIPEFPEGGKTGRRSVHDHW